MAKLLVASQEETRAVLQIHSVRWLSCGLIRDGKVHFLYASNFGGMEIG